MSPCNTLYIKSKREKCGKIEKIVENESKEKAGEYKSTKQNFTRS
jgi:hypothetical protein